MWSANETGDFEKCFAVDELLGAKLGAARYTCYVKYEFSTQGAVTDVGLHDVYMELDVQMSGAGLP